MRYYANGIAFIYDKNGKDFINKHLKQSFGCEMVVLNSSRLTNLSNVNDFLKFFKIPTKVYKNFLSHGGFIFLRISGESKQKFYIHYRSSSDVQRGPDIKPTKTIFDD